MKARKFFTYLILLVVAANLALVAYVFLSAPEPKPIPMPNPNGYDDFVKATPVMGTNYYAYDKMDLKELAALVSTNEEALTLLHLGLSRECRVPDDYSTNFIATMIPALSIFKQSVFLLCAEGKLAEREGKTNDAVKIYLDAARFSQESTRGGLIIHKLVAIACQAIAFKPLAALHESLDAKQCGEIARVLEDMDAKAEPVEESLAHEKDFGRRMGGISYPVLKLLSYKQESASRQRFMQKFNSSQAYRRRVMLDFAERAYELEKGQRPASPADLVPAYLKAIPQDPMTGTNMVFAR